MTLSFASRSFLARLHRWRVCERASSAIEFACVAPMFIALLLGIGQVSIIYLAQSYLQAMTEAAMRTVLTNNASNLTQPQFNAAVCANITALFNCNNLIIDLQPITATSPSAVASSLPQFNSSGNLVNPTTFNVGNSADKMLLVIMYQWPVIGGPLGLTFANMGNGTKLLTATEVFYKEPCLNANGC